MSSYLHKGLDGDENFPSFVTPKILAQLEYKEESHFAPRDWGNITRFCMVLEDLAVTKKREKRRFQNKIHKWAKHNKYGKILSFYELYGETLIRGIEPLYITPSRKILWTIYDNVRKFNCRSIHSVGAGSGLFEAMIENIMGIPTYAIDVYEESKKNIRYVKPERRILIGKREEYIIIPEDSAVMFPHTDLDEICEDYLEKYKGNLVIIVRGNEFHSVYPDLDWLDENLKWESVPLENKRVSCYFRR